MALMHQSVRAVILRSLATLGFGKRTFKAIARKFKIDD